uniref:Anthocyanin 5-aromatic acyltransferase n=1 Tax=Aegilops tauschii subsp. strangulata TaxID=200361 RepID=A0A453QMX3_AEGTS
MGATADQVRILSVTHVQPDRQTTNLWPLADDHTIMKLSFLDSFHVATGPIQRLFFYDGPGLPPFPFIAGSLRSSLAATLHVFLPLAGKLAFRPASGHVVLDCSPSAVSSSRVKFVEAEFLPGADALRRLAGDEEHDTEAFAWLVPELDDAGKLPAPVLAVQVTRPAGDGRGVVAVGVSLHHAVADGKSFWQFLRWWSAASRGDLLTAVPGDLMPPPPFDRTAIRHRREEELTAWILRLRAPMLPTLGHRWSSSTACRRTKTFLLVADEIQSLKQRLSQKLPKPASAYVAISSLAWTCIVGAKMSSHMIHDDDDAFLMVHADCRGRLHRPPIDKGFFGNCVKPCYARARAANLMPPRHLVEHNDGLAHAAAAIQETIRDGLEAAGENLFANFGEVLKYHMALPPGRASTVGSSHRFMAYETDFGWGPPSRVELASISPFCLISQESRVLEYVLENLHIS